MVSTTAEKAAGENRVSDDPNVLADNDLVKITLGAPVIEEKYVGYNILIENRSDQYILVSARNCSVDGYMTNVSVYTGEVAPGKKAKREIRVYTENSDVKTFSDLKDVEGSFDIGISDNGGASYSVGKNLYSFVIPDNEAGAGGAEVGGEAGADKIETISADDAKLTEQ